MTVTQQRPDTVAKLLTATDPALAARLHGELSAVEELLRRTISDGPALMAEAAGYLLAAGGKRMRPLLVLLGAEFGDPARPAVRQAAASVELIHAATLYHDDVMDGAPLRHGVPSAHVRWNTKIAILAGDYLFTKAASLDLPQKAKTEQAQCVARLVAGQIAETAGPAAGVDPLDHHLGVLHDKSASLIRLSARLGGLCSGAGRRVSGMLAEYGELLGMAFQLSDDLIDVLSEPSESGKGAGTDLREGVLTLPVLHALALDGGRLAELLASGPLTDPARHAEALELLRRSPAIGSARAEVERYAGEAAAIARALPPRPAREVLLALCEHVVHRTI
ncbi:polyprenyl synthetase family protein [Nonomuraea sp. NPDC050328]|uniref:polyprenyl synthetase family protein n=1 Tax=Nonomuraea sp. NPDC050328 TaxID=3364361 RepID=UPI0037BA1B7F